MFHFILHSFSQYISPVILSAVDGGINLKLFLELVYLRRRHRFPEISSMDGHDCRELCTALGNVGTPARLGSFWSIVREYLAKSKVLMLSNFYGPILMLKL